MPRLLLVEDEPGLVMTLTDRLAAEGYEVVSAVDGETGLLRASTEPFDVILLDGMLPRRDGFDVCRSLRQRNVQTPILMLTARGQVVDRVVGLKLGADDYLVKPFEMAELLARDRVLQHAQHPPQVLLRDDRASLDALTIVEASETGAEEPARRGAFGGVVRLQPGRRARLIHPGNGGHQVAVPRSQRHPSDGHRHGGNTARRGHYSTTAGGGARRVARGLGVVGGGAQGWGYAVALGAQGLIVSAGRRKRAESHV